MFLNFLLMYFVVLWAIFKLVLICLVMPFMFLLDIFNILPNWLVRWYSNTISRVISGLDMIIGV